MPFDFENLVPYDVDYNDLLIEMRRIPIFMKYPEIQGQYINKWIDTIKYYDESIVNLMNDKEEIRKIIIEKKKETKISN